MNFPVLPAQATAAIATFAATLITSLITLANLTMTKETKVSEMRRDWIEALRGELADYFQSMRHIANAVDEMSEEESKFKRAKVEEAIQTANSAYYRVRLRLNDRKELHKSLRNVLDSIEKTYSDWQTETPNLGPAIIAKIESAIPASRELIDSEWKRVKHGEKAYRTVRNWIVPGSLLIVVVFVAALSVIKFV